MVYIVFIYYLEKIKKNKKWINLFVYVNDKYFTNFVILLFNINIIILKIKSLKYFFNHKKIENIKFIIY